VLTAVQFDGEIRPWARKIDNPPSDGMAPKLPEDEAFAQRVPQETFNIGHLAT
jgi:hypothetical protein